MRPGSLEEMLPLCALEWLLFSLATIMFESPLLYDIRDDRYTQCRYTQEIGITMNMEEAKAIIDFALLLFISIQTNDRANRYLKINIDII